MRVCSVAGEDSIQGAPGATALAMTERGLHPERGQDRQFQLRLCCRDIGLLAGNRSCRSVEAAELTDIPHGGRRGQDASTPLGCIDRDPTFHRIKRWPSCRVRRAWFEDTFPEGPTPAQESPGRRSPRANTFFWYRRRERARRWRRFSRYSIGSSAIRREAGSAPGLRCVYVSPLRSLNYEIDAT